MYTIDMVQHGLPLGRDGGLRTCEVLWSGRNKLDGGAKVGRGIKGGHSELVNCLTGPSLPRHPAYTASVATAIEHTLLRALEPEQ